MATENDRTSGGDDAPGLLPEVVSDDQESSDEELEFSDEESPHGRGDEVPERRLCCNKKSNVPRKRWRRNWFVRTFLAEVPIVGHFFSKSKCSDILYYALKSVCELAGGGAAMALIPEEPAETEKARIFKLTVAMAAGKAVGAMAYNTVIGGARMLYDCYLKHSFLSHMRDDEVEIRSEEKNEVVLSETKDCRENSVSKIIFSEIPIVGHFLREPKCSDAFYFAGKSICELTVGGIGMSLEASTEQVLITRLAAATVGMFAGGVVYNTVGSVGNSVGNGVTLFYHCCLSRRSKNVRDRQGASLNAQLVS